MDIVEFVNKVTTYKVTHNLDTKDAIKLYCQTTQNCNGIQGTIFDGESVRTVMKKIIKVSNLDDELIQSIKKELSHKYKNPLTSCKDYHLFGDEAMKIHYFFLKYIYYKKKEDFISVSQIIDQMDDIISVYTRSIESGEYYESMSRVLFGENSGKKVNHRYGSKEYIFLLELMVKVLPKVNTRCDNKSTYIIKKDTDCYIYTGTYIQFSLLLKLVYDNHENEIPSKGYSPFLSDSVWLFTRIENRSVETNTKPIEIENKEDDKVAYKSRCNAIRVLSYRAAKIDPRHDKNLVQDDRFLLTQKELIDILKDKDIIKC